MLETFHHGDSRIFLEEAPLAIVPVLLVAGISCWAYLGLQLEPWLVGARREAPALTSTQSGSMREHLRVDLGRIRRAGAPDSAASRTGSVRVTDILPVGAFGTEEPAPTAPEEPCAPQLEFRFNAGGFAPARLVGDRLDAFLDHARAYPERKLVIEGYASRDGDPAVNLRLSHARASTVATVLRGHGIPEARLVVQAFGEYRPSIDGDDDRRAVVRIDGSPPCAGESIP